MIEVIPVPQHSRQTQYLRRSIALMTARKTVAGLLMAAAIGAVIAAPAHAGPSGDEYLPKVPSATGEKSANSAGASSTPTPSTNTSTETTASPTAGQGTTNQKKHGKKTEPAVVPTNSNDNGSSGGGSSGLLPVILLIVAGVIVTAVGMTLRRRQSGRGPDPEAGGRERVAGDRPNTPRTPDGEILPGPDRTA
jgi:hypothetical protein